MLVGEQHDVVQTCDSDTSISTIPCQKDVYGGQVLQKAQETVRKYGQQIQSMSRSAATTQQAVNSSCIKGN